MNNTETNKNPFKCLKGEQLSSVIFVQNYLQLDFDGYRITFYRWPLVKLNEKEYTIREIDYRNVLCSLIAKEVSDVILLDENIFTIIFSENHKINLNLKNAEGEVIYFTTPEGEWSSI